MSYVQSDRNVNFKSRQPPVTRENSVPSPERKLNVIKPETQLGLDAYAVGNKNGYSVRKCRYYFLSHKSILYIRYHVEGKKTALYLSHKLRHILPEVKVI